MLSEYPLGVTQHEPIIHLPFYAASSWNICGGLLCFKSMMEGVLPVRTPLASANKLESQNKENHSCAFPSYLELSPPCWP